MTDLRISQFLPVIEAYAARTAGGNIMDYEDAMQSGCELVLKALRAYKPERGDLAQYVTMRLAEVLEIGRQAVTEPTPFTDVLPEEADSEPEYLMGEILPEDAIDSIPDDSDYPDTADEATPKADSFEAQLYARFNLNLVQVGDDPGLDGYLKHLADQFTAIRKMPKDAPVRRLFVWLKLIDQGLPALEVAPAFTYDVPAVTREAGEAFALYAEEPDTLADSRPERTASWMGEDGEGPDSSTEITFPANGWHAPIFSISEVGVRGQAVQPKLLVELTTSTLVSLGKHTPEDEEEFEPTTLELADTWELPTEWGSRHQLDSFFETLDAPTKWSRNGRKAFCLAFIRGLGLDAAKSAAWSAHRHTVVSARPQGLVQGNGVLIPWAKAEASAWKLSLDISREAMCQKVWDNLKHVPAAAHFATVAEHGQMGWHMTHGDTSLDALGLAD